MAICYCGRTDYDSHQPTIQCANCKNEVHIECANLPPFEVPNILTFYCQYCSQTMGPTQMKSITNYHRNDRHETNALNNAVEAGTADFVCYLKNSTEIEDSRAGDVRKMRGQQLSIKDLIDNGFDKPILVESKDGLDMSCPIEPSTPIESLAQYYDQDIIEAFETTRQKTAKYRFSNLLAQFAPMYSNERQNVFSFQINLFKYKPKRVTKIDDGRPVRIEGGRKEFLPPRIVQKLSWVDSYWPVVPSRPELSKYLFVSMANSFTQFHIDIGACASWHHVIRGEQIFYLAEPTPHNLQAFRQWSKSPLIKEEMFFRSPGVQRVYKQKVSDGETIFIPNGWIYAVLSMEDCIVFGGYFLHSLNMAKQIEMNDFLADLEKENKVSYAFPAYEFTNWYAAPNVIKLVKQMQNQSPKHLFEGIEALVEKLKFWLKKSKSKRGDNAQYVPTCVECSKIIRDLNACLSKSGIARSKIGLSSTKKSQKRPISSSEFVQDSDDDAEEHGEGSDEFESEPEDNEQNEPIKKIKDLISTSNKNDKGGLNLKMKLNINKFQDVIRQTAEQGRTGGLYDQNPFGQKKLSKREKMEQAEIKKIMKESQGEDDDYVYMNDSAKASSKLRPDDSVWKPGTSLESGGSTARKSTPKETAAKPTPAPFAKPKVTLFSMARLEPTAKPPTSTVKPEKEKKPKKGLATPKQRLAKKLKI